MYIYIYAQTHASTQAYSKVKTLSQVAPSLFCGANDACPMELNKKEGKHHLSKLVLLLLAIL